jgi:hypothetical protein
MLHTSVPLVPPAGLSQEAREDFRVMKDVAEYTRISPQQRAQTLQGFNHEIHKLDFLSHDVCL